MSDDGRVRLTIEVTPNAAQLIHKERMKGRAKGIPNSITVSRLIEAGHSAFYGT